MNQNNDFNKAVWLIVISSLTNSLVCVFVKKSGNISAVQKLFFQNLIVVFLGLPLMIKYKYWIKLNKITFLPLLLRCSLGVVAAGTSFYCLQKMLIADVNMILQLCPVFTAVFGFLILKEKFPAKNWIYYITALFGCLFIIKPTANNILLIPSLLCILCSMISAVNLNLMRLLGKHGMIGLPVIFFFGIFSLIVISPWIVFNYEPMDLNQITYIVLLGIFTLITQILLSYAYTMMQGGKIAIYSYSGMFFCGLFGYLFFKEIPDILSLVGYAIIIISSILIYIRDKLHYNCH